MLLGIIGTRGKGSFWISCETAWNITSDLVWLGNKAAVSNTGTRLISAKSECVNTLRFSVLEVPIPKGLNALQVCRQTDSSQDGTSGYTALQSLFTSTYLGQVSWPAFDYWAMGRKWLNFSPVPSGQVPHHKKIPPIIQLTLIGSFLSSSEERPRLEHHGNRTNCSVSASPQNRHTWMQCCGRLMWHLKKYRFQIPRLLQSSTFTNIQIHLH